LVSARGGRPFYKVSSSGCNSHSFAWGVSKKKKKIGEAHELRLASD